MTSLPKVSSNVTMTLWTAPQVLKFIELYRSLECLWKVRSKEYTNKLLRDLAYEKLIEFGQNISGVFTREDAMKKINNLRSAYRKEVKKIAKSEACASRPEDVYSPRLFYFQDLHEFLADQDDFKPGSSTTSRDDRLTSSRIRDTFEVGDIVNRTIAGQ